MATVHLSRRLGNLALDAENRSRYIVEHHVKHDDVVPSNATAHGARP
jgi:hypothetical protein